MNLWAKQFWATKEKRMKSAGRLQGNAAEPAEMTAMNYLEGKRNEKSYYLVIAMARGSQKICRCKFMPESNLARVKLVARSDRILCWRIWKVKVSLAEAPVVGRIGRKKQHQNEQHHALHLGLRLLVRFVILAGTVLYSIL